MFPKAVRILLRAVGIVFNGAYDGQTNLAGMSVAAEIQIYALGRSRLIDFWRVGEQNLEAIGGDSG